MAIESARRLQLPSFTRRAVGSTDRGLDRGSAAFLLAIAVVAAVARASSYHVPLNRDTGQLLYGGDVILEGGTPYTDAALNKGPAAYLLFALVRAVSGRSEVVVRLTLLVTVIVAAIAIAACLRRVAGRDAGLLGGLLFAVLAPCAGFQGDDPNLPQYAVAPMAVALALAVRGGWVASAGAGVATALTGLLSPAFLIPLVPALLVIGLWHGRETYLRRVGIAVASAAVVGAAVLAWLALSGAIDDLLVQVPGLQEAPRTERFFSLRRLLEVPDRGLWIAGLVGASVALREPSLRLPAMAAVMWIVLSWARLKIGDYIVNDSEYPHHAYPAIVGIVLGLALGIASLWPPSSWGRAALAALVLVAPVTTSVASPQIDAFKRPPHERGIGSEAWGASYKLAGFIDDRTRPNDSLFVAASNPELYWLADRRAPTRFFETFSLGADASYARQRAQELRRAPPRAIAVVTGNSLDPVLQELVREKGYRLALNVSEGRVWLRP